MFSKLSNHFVFPLCPPIPINIKFSLSEKFRNGEKYLLLEQQFFTRAFRYILWLTNFTLNSFSIRFSSRPVSATCFKISSLSWALFASRSLIREFNSSSLLVVTCVGKTLAECFWENTETDFVHYCNKVESTKSKKSPLIVHSMMLGIAFLSQLRFARTTDIVMNINFIRT